MADVKEAPRKAYPSKASDYNIFQLIGVGAFAKVYRGEVKATKEPIAIKLIDLEQLNANWDEIRKEVLAMRTMNHPNVVSIYISFVEGQILWMVMPIMGAGSCAAILKKKFPSGIKDEALLATVLREVLKGLVYFHGDRRIHRDVKAGNILVSEEGEVKLGDFGVAGTLNDSGQRIMKRQTFTGTPCWMAPEVMEQTGGYDTKADIWSFGITAMELAFGKPPYHDYQPMKVLLTTLQKDPPTIDVYEKDPSRKNFSRAFRSMLEKVLKKSPKKRPPAVKLLQHRFFEKAKDSKYIVDNLLSGLPKMPRGGEPLTLSSEELAAHPQKTKEEPLAVASWVFDVDEVRKMREETQETKKEPEREASINSDEEEEEEDDGAAGGTGVSPMMMALGIGAPTQAASESEAEPS
eukprot:gb/GEZN01006628.1/.p1 GENE.gb/GEZN01006628.1/~~gb/GEZN01006628.1/.p1  ORF type:complete len:407 (+),score=79.91 gb/GEZN01006628.1/:117-1337(+)